MSKPRRGDIAANDHAPPILVTEWGDFTVAGGVLFVPLRSGFQPFTIAMGPAMALDAIARAQRALSFGVVERLLSQPDPAH